MKLLISACILAHLVVLASAVNTQKAVIVSYPSDTPDSVISDAMAVIREAVSNIYWDPLELANGSVSAGRYNHS